MAREEQKSKEEEAADRLRRRLPRQEPWSRVIPTKREAYAARAMEVGNANSVQQAIFMDLVYRISGVRDLEFRPESERASAFASGKRFVGLQIALIANLAPESIDNLDP